MQDDKNAARTQASILHVSLMLVIIVRLFMYITVYWIDTKERERACHKQNADEEHMQ